MKRFTLILALVLMIAMPTFAERVTSETARKVATTFLSNNGAKSAQLTDLSKEAGFPNLYIFNAEQGFVVMSADDCVKPILGYSLTGKFQTENMPTNVSGWLQGYNDEIQYAIDNKMKASAETSKLWKDLSEGNSKAAKATIVVDALIQTTWDQDPGYNALCPYDSNAGELTVTGCVATAMAQIMRYWEYPSHGVGSNFYTPSTHPEYGVQSVNFAQAIYDWTDMPLYSPNSEIAKLMYHCGVAVDMDYNISSNGGSSAYNTSITPALTNYFNYKSTANLKWKDSYSGNWIDLLKTELNAGRPIEYNGSGSAGGHAFVCDGYDNSNYFHFNWGWSGRNDGFYSLSNLNPGSGGSGGGSYNFTNNQSAVIGIQPKDCTVSTPTNFNVTAEDRNAVLTWTAVTNATAYSIYRNGFLIANTINATYTDSNLAYGTYAYYIKSRDANGAASSPTATVNIAIEPIPFNLTVTKNGNDAMLNWTEPEWSAPQNDDEVLTYGDGSYVTNFGVSNVTNMYWGHRYPTNTFSNKVLYKVSFYTTDTGSFKLFIYKGSSATSSRPSTKIAEQTITTSVTGWIDIELDTPIQIDNTKDLWVFMYDPEGRGYPAVACSYSGNDGNYFASNPTSNVNAWSGYAFNIRTYIANGSFTYNLYDNNTNIASSLSGTSYNIANISNNTAHQYTLKTYFNNGLTSASNMAGITIGTATIANLEMTANDQMTITENSKLTVSGVLSNSNAANLILENGSQLIHGSPNVQATVKKDIAAYTINTNNNWNLIASPVTENITPSADNGLLSETYDLYYYDEPTHYWRNYRNATFNLTHQQGYLYANNTNTTLQFAGSLTPSNSSVTLTDLSHSATVLNGFNLVGNPFACNATVDKSFYVTDETGSNIVLADNGRQVKPCEGIFVQATNSNTSVTFTKAGTKSRSLSSSFDITLTQGRTTIDRTRVHLDNMESLEKFSLNDNTSSQIYFTRNGKNFAVTYANGQNELPLNFKTSQNGIYNLNIEAENLDLDYLHLIDNLTGNDIDLLTTSSYTFETKTSDYASRFRLVFSNCEDAVGDNATFAYVNNGNIVINQEGTLQIVDMTGRVVYQGDTMNRVSTTGMAQGVYVLRLITAVDTKTQKIVIE